MQLYTSRWANKDLAHLDVVPVGISRGVPRWRTPYRYKQLRMLAPSREALAISDREAFEEAYVAGLEEIGVEAILVALERIGAEHGGKPLVLLCFEPIGVPCHRLAFGEWWKEKTGQQAPELLPGMVPLREDMPAQEILF